MSANEVWWKKVVDNNFVKLVQLYEASDEDYETELFTKLLDKNYDINYMVSDDYIFEKDWLVGQTIFQLCSSYNPKICQILISHGADYTSTDKNGSTYLIKETTEHEQKSYLDSFVGVILSAHINSGNFTNPKDDRGLSHFLVACMYNRVDVAKFFLENGVSANETVNSNSNFYPGFTALHFAAKSNALQIVELLLSMDADVFAKDSKGISPLHLLIVDRRETFVKLKRHSRIENSMESNYSNLTKYYTKNEKIIYLLLDRMKETSFYLNIDIGLSYFHVLCFMGNTSTVEQLLDDNREYLTQSVSAESSIWSGFTPLHFAAQCNAETVELLVKIGADLSAKDAKGVTPFEICLREFSIEEVHRIVLLQPDYSSIVFSDGKTKLCDFIHAMQDSVTFENFLKGNLSDPNMLIPFNSPVCAGCTPLHLIVMCIEQPMSWSTKNLDNTHTLAAAMKSEKSLAYLLRMDSCLHYSPDVTIKDARGFTPLHWAFKLQQSKAVYMLLDRHESNANPIDEDGLSHLHIACAAKNESLVKKLLSGGAKVNEAVTSSYTWLDLNTVEKRYTMLERGHNCFIQQGSTPLHFATIVDCPKTVEILIDNGADVLARDVDDLTPLERIFEAPIFRDSKCPKPSRTSTFTTNENEIAKSLVRKIGDLLVDTKPKQILYCYSLLEGKLLSEILSHDDESATRILASVGITALHVACFTRNLLQVNKLVGEIDVNARVDSESPLWPGCTPLHLFVKMANRSATNKTILKKLLRRGADVTAMNAEGETPIHQCFPYNSHYLGKLLVNIKNFSVNPASKRGFTHLHIASALNGDWIIEKLLQQGAFVDEPNDYFIHDYGGFTALHLAVAYRQKNAVDVLIKHGADVNWRNALGGNSLHAAMGEYRLPCFEVLRSLIKAGADIHARNMFGDSPLECLVKSFSRAKEEIELFLENGSRVNTFNSKSDEGFLAIALNKSQELPIFDMVCKSPDVKAVDDSGRNAIHNVVAFKRPDDESLDDDEDINEIYATSDDYIKAIATLLTLGLNIDQQDCKGSTPLHLAARMRNLNGIIGLLENGADINITDADGKSAFARSLDLAEIHNDSTELDLTILEIISNHAYKMNLASIGISPSNREVGAKIGENYTVDPPRVEQCSDEIERMQEQKISSTSVTFYEFLSDTGAVSAFPHMLPFNRVAIDSFFKNQIVILRENFPELTGVLLLQYRKALARVDMIDPAVSSLNILVGFNVPAVITRIILRYLNNDELNNLINSIDE